MIEAEKRQEVRDMYSDGKLWVARGERDLYLLPAMANRH